MKLLCRHIWLHEDGSQDTSGAMPVFELCCAKCGLTCSTLGLQNWERVRQVSKNTWVLREVTF